jgi:hypothetical protein
VQAAVSASCRQLAGSFQLTPRLAQLELDIPQLLPQQLSSLQAVTALHLRGARPGASLPGGPWLFSLRRLAAEPDLVCDSLDSLQDAFGLEELALLQAWRRRGEAAGGNGDVAAVFQWAAGCRCPLRQLAVDEALFSTADASLLQSVLEAHRRRPTLLMDVVHDAGQGVCSPEFHCFASHHGFHLGYPY